MSMFNTFPFPVPKPKTLVIGGASAGKFDFPEKALSRPDYATEDSMKGVMINVDPLK